MDTEFHIQQLNNDGIIILHDIIPEILLKNMQRAFEQKLSHITFNSTYGSQRTEMFRHYVEDLLMVDPSFVKFAINPELMKIVRGYISNDVVLKECRGWQTKIVKKHFHSWHKDGWYDKKIYSSPPRQLKVVIYLTDVSSGSFSYIKGTHNSVKSNPDILHEHFNDQFLEPYKENKIFALGKAGTVVIFNTAGIHCQNSPNLLPRNAAFYTFHSPEIQIDQSEMEYNRYEPLLISNEFIDDTFTMSDLKMLGFFQKPAASTRAHKLIRYPVLSSIVRAELEATIYMHEYIFSNFKRITNRIVKETNKLFKKCTER